MAVGENCRHRFSRAFTLGFQTHASRVYQGRNWIAAPRLASKGQRATTRGCAGKNSVRITPEDLGSYRMPPVIESEASQPHSSILKLPQDLTCQRRTTISSWIFCRRAYRWSTFQSCSSTGV